MIIDSKSRQLLIISLLIILIIISFTTPGNTTPIPSALDKTVTDYFSMSPSIPWNISARHFSYCNKSGEYKLSGNVIIQKNKIEIKTNFLLFDYNTMRISTKCKTSVKIEEDYLLCNALDINIDQETGFFYDGTIFLRESSLQISGEKFEKTDTNTYYIHEGNLTSCLGTSPVWIITGENIYIKKGNHGIIRKAVLKIKGIPILGSPYLLFPTTKRQSGLLTPEIRYTNNILSYCQPIFLRINDWSDITLYPRYELNTKTSIGLEYRYILSHNTKGLIMIDGGKYNNTIEEKNSKTQSLVEKSDYFYWIRSKAVHKLPFQIVAKLGMDLVSNDDYLKNNREGYSGFYRTEKYFKKFMGKDLLPYDTYPRTNYLILSRIWPHYTLNASTYWNNQSRNSIATKKGNIPSETLTIQFGSNQQKIKSSPLYFNLEVNQTYEKNNNDNNEQKIEIKPKILLTQTLKNLATLDISLGTDQIFTRNNGKLFSNHSNNFTFKTGITSEVSKIFDTKTEKLLKHSLKLRTIYEYGSNSFNCFESFKDNKNKENSFTYSITNSIISRALDNSEVKSKKYIYAELFYLHLKQSFNWGKTVNHFSDIFGELYLNVKDNLILQTQLEYNPKTRSISLHNFETCLGKSDGSCISAVYTYERSKIKLIESHFGTALNKNLTLIASCGYDYTEKKILTESIGFYYTSQCWSANVNYKNNKKIDSQSISISIELFGFGNQENNTFMMKKNKSDNITSLLKKGWTSKI